MKKAIYWFVPALEIWGAHGIPGKGSYLRANLRSRKKFLSLPFSMVISLFRASAIIAFVMTALYLVSINNEGVETTTMVINVEMAVFLSFIAVVSALLIRRWDGITEITIMAELLDTTPAQLALMDEAEMKGLAASILNQLGSFAFEKNQVNDLRLKYRSLKRLKLVNSDWTAYLSEGPLFLFD